MNEFVYELKDIKHSVCVFSDSRKTAQQRRIEIETGIPNGSLVLSHACENDPALESKSESFDLGIVIFEDLSDTKSCLAVATSASSCCRFTIAFAPVVVDSSEEGSDSLFLTLSQLESVVDTLVLTPCVQQEIREEVLATIPLLLTRSFTGIDYADIQYVLTSGMSANGHSSSEARNKESKPGACIVAWERYGSNDTLASAALLGKRVANMYPAPLKNCLLSIPIARVGSSVTLQDINDAAESVYSAICQTSATRVYGTPIVDTDIEWDGLLTMVCIAGPINLTTDLVDRLLSQRRQITRV